MSMNGDKLKNLTKCTDKVEVKPQISVMRKAYIALFAVAMTVAACSEKDYNCYCLVDGPDSLGVGVNYDTNLTLVAKNEDLANTECAAYEGVGSQLIPDGVVGDNVTIECNVTGVLESADR